MNDKFNDDDFSWLNDPDDPKKKEDSSQEDDSFAWQQSDESRPNEQSGKHLGVTGQLSWRRDEGTAGDDQGEEDDEGFAWQAGGDDAPAAPNRTGLTGTLSWQRANQPEKSSSDWMSDFSSAFDKMSESDDEPAAQSDTPDWLKAAAPPAAQAPKVDDTFETPGSDMPSWLQGSDDDFDAPQAAQVEDTFEPAGDMPSWLQGDDDTSADDMFSAPPAAPAPAAADVPDWLSGFDDDEPAAVPPAAASAEVPSLDDLFGGDTPGAITSEVPDWLSGFGADEPAAVPPAAASAPPSLDDLFGGDAPAAPSLDDLFGSDTPDAAQWEAAPWDGEAAQPQEDFAADDLFPSMDDEEVEEDAAAPMDTGFLAEMGLSKPSARQPETPQSASVDDFLAGLGFGDEEGEPALPDPSTFAPAATGDDDFDWFAAQPEEAAPATIEEAPDWLDGLGDLETLGALTEEAEEEEPAFPEMNADDADPFADFETPEVEAEPAAPQYQDIDALMSSFGDDELDLPRTDELKLRGGDIDFDTLLNQDALGDVGIKKPQSTYTSDFTQESSDLLADLGVTVGQVSASSIMRQQQDRPLEELSDRLQALRERSMDAPAAPPVTRASTSLANVLPGVSETLAPTPIQTGAPSIAGAVILGKEQQDRVALLRQLVGAGAQVTQTGDAAAPYTDWEADIAAAPAKAPPKITVRPHRRFRPKADRLLISLLLIAVIVLPFVFDGARMGTLPALQFAPGTSQYAVYDSINTLNSGDLVLVAVEYGPTAAGELDSMTDVLLRHIMARGAHPVVVSRNPVGLLHAGNILSATGGTANRDYYLTRYVTADIVGLRSLAQNINATLLTDVNGNPTGLNVASLNDFARIVVIVERAEDLRTWAEQIAPLTSTPLLAGTNYAASPLSEPYLNAGLGTSAGLRGLLVGAGDAYTYRAMFEGWTAQAAPTSTPTTETPAEVTPTQQPLIGDVTEEATAEATPEATATRRVIVVTATQPLPLATNTSEPSPTREPATDTPTTAVTPSRTPQPSPTNTPRPTITPTVEAVPVFAFVSVSDTVNIRSEPSRDSAAVGSARSGARVEVLGISDDGLWLNIRTTQGLEGWILGELLTIESSPSPKRAVMPQRTTGSDVNQEPTPEGTAESNESEATAEITQAVNATPVIRPTTVRETPTTQPAVEVTANASSQVGRDRQWYATTLGLVFIVIVIALGNLANLIRGLLRRSRTR